MSTTSIEWVQRPGTEAKVFNPSRGCSRVSDGCRHCWAERMAHRFNGPGQPYEGLTTIRGGRPGWTGEVRFVPEMLAEPLKWRKPCTVFVGSMSDIFHEQLTNEQIAAVFGVMAACPQHTFQVLTKRAKRMREWFEWAATRYVPVHHWCLSRMLNLDTGIRGGVGNEDVKHAWDNAAWPLPNAWIGVSVENQATADERIPELLQCPAAVHFVSAEPLLGPVDVSRWAFDREAAIDKAMYGPLALNREQADARIAHPLSWVIVGSESGPGARPMHPDWARYLVQQCRDSGTACFFKQLGAWRPRSFGAEPNGRPWGTLSASGEWFLGATPWNGRTLDDSPDREEVMVHVGGKGGDQSEWPEDLRIRQWPEVAR